MCIFLWVAASPTGFYRGAQSGLTVAHTCDVYLCVRGKLGLDAICHQRGRRLEEAVSQKRIHIQSLHLFYSR